jgi:hypothetical protein
LGSNIEAFFEWAKLDIVSPLREIRYRYIAATELTVSPPAIVLRPAEEAGEMIPEVEALARWIDSEFLGELNEVHCRFFNLGLETFLLLDDALQTEGNARLLEEARQQAVDASREFLTSLADDIDAGKFVPGVFESLRARLRALLARQPTRSHWLSR